MLLRAYSVTIGSTHLARVPASHAGLLKSHHLQQESCHCCQGVKRWSAVMRVPLIGHHQVWSLVIVIFISIYKSLYKGLLPGWDQLMVEKITMVRPGSMDTGSWRLKVSRSEYSTIMLVGLPRPQCETSDQRIKGLDSDLARHSPSLPSPSSTTLTNLTMPIWKWGIMSRSTLFNALEACLLRNG